MIELRIDGKSIQTQEDKTVIEAAHENGIDIPHLCYHPELSASGGCRLCLVEVEGQSKPVASCGLVCRDGMIVHTKSAQLSEMRREILDLVLSTHPLDCVICDKAGSCLLQKYAYEYDISKTSYDFTLPRTLFQDDNPFFIRDHQYCILCSRCVRVCSEVVGAQAIEITGRGFDSHVATPFDGPMIDSSCVYCGSCVQVCPTAALMPVSRMGRGREWDLERVETVCGYCGVGCHVEYALKDGDILYANGAGDNSVNGELLCSKGRYGWDFAKNRDRLTSPLIRRDVAYELGLTDDPWEMPQISPLAIREPDILDSHIEVEWDRALDLVAERLAGTVKEYGPDAVMGLTSARCTNEENYIFQKFMRVAIGTNNLDHCARL
jgi:predicted molibdopterin-dependent oxidoreductase YjgC